MNYRHAYHAGNFADVLKHGVLCWIVRYLQQKPGPLCLIDTHGGAGLYDLTAKPAEKTGEANDGILRLIAQPGAPPPLKPYLDLVRAANDGGAQARHYPGSPALLSALARPSDRAIVCELHADDAAALGHTLGRTPRLRIVTGDGYRALTTLVPPPEKRGLVLIDPPFEDPGEFETLAGAFIAAHRKWPTGAFVLWHPFKDTAAVSRFHSELVSAGIPKLLTVALDVGRTDPGLSAAGLVLCNAPFTFEAEWREALAWLTPVLAQGVHASFSLARLSPE